MVDLDPVTPVWRANYAMALSYNQRLDEAEALLWLDRYLDNVRGDARFGQVMERARREWERFQV